MSEGPVRYFSWRRFLSRLLDLVAANFMVVSFFTGLAALFFGAGLVEPTVRLVTDSGFDPGLRAAFLMVVGFVSLLWGYSIMVFSFIYYEIRRIREVVASAQG